MTPLRREQARPAQAKENIPPRRRMQRGQDGLQHGSGHCLSLSGKTIRCLLRPRIRTKARESSKSQAYLGDIIGSVPDHCSRTINTVKRVLRFFPVHTKVMFTLYCSLSRRRQWHPTPVLLPGKSHGRRSLVGCSPWGRQESDMTKRLHFHTLEKEMATHSRVLAWRIPGMGEPGGLPSMG